MAYFSALTGDPFYRYHIDVNHAPRASRAWCLGTGEILNVQGIWRVGGPIFHPILSLLFNQEFGLLFWVFIPAAIWACRAKTIVWKSGVCYRLLTGLGMVWMVFISYTGLLGAVPRFYTVSLWTATIVIVYGSDIIFTQLAEVCDFPRRQPSCDQSALHLRRKQKPSFCRTCACCIHGQHDGVVVYTDPSTVRLAGLLLEFKGVSDRVRNDPVPPGGYFTLTRRTSNIAGDMDAHTLGNSIFPRTVGRC